MRIAPKSALALAPGVVEADSLKCLKPVFFEDLGANQTQCSTIRVIP